MSDVVQDKVESTMRERLRVERETLAKILEALGALSSESRKRILDAARIMAGCALAAILLAGCGDHRSRAVDPAPGAAPVATVAPVFSDADPRWNVEVDRYDAIQQRWIAPGWRGLPPGWTVVPNETSGWTHTDGRLIYGLCHFDTWTIEVSRHAVTPQGVQFSRVDWPALGHELAHAWVYTRTASASLASQAGH